MNKCFIAGFIGSDPEVRATNSGLSVVTVSVATTHSFKKDGEWNKETTWHKCKAFGGVADMVAKFSKGNYISLETSLRSSKWTDKDGNLRTEYFHVVDSIGCPTPKKEGRHGNSSNAKGEDVAPPPDMEGVPF